MPDFSDAFQFNLRWLISSPFANPGPIPPANFKEKSTGAAMNTFFYGCDDAVDLAAAAAVLWDHFAETYADALNERAWLYAVSLDEVPGDYPAHERHDEEFGPLQGFADSPALPNQCCVCIQRRTGTAGKSGLGRVFLSQVRSEVFVIDFSGDNQQNDRVDTENEYLLAVAEKIASPVVVGSTVCTPCLYNRASQQLTPVTEAHVMPVLAVLRARRTIRRQPFPVV